MDRSRDLRSAWATNAGAGDFAEPAGAHHGMRLDDALDHDSAAWFLTQMRTNFLGGWVMYRARPHWRAAAGVGFLGGELSHRYQMRNAPKPTSVVMLNHPNEGVLQSDTVFRCRRTISEMVQVNYNKIVRSRWRGRWTYGDSEAVAVGKPMRRRRRG